MTSKTDMTHAELAQAARNYDATANEGGEGYNPYRAEIDRRFANDDEFLAEWTLGITKSRRIEWNDWAKSGGDISPAAVARRQDNQGWRMGDLRRAVKLHNL